MNRDDDFLSRWSRRKHAARKGETAPGAAPVLPAADRIQEERASSDRTALEPARAAEPLPPLESLTPESDFSPFMDKEVDPGLRREALKTLFRDPRHNIMDGLDVYIDDYSKPDPIPPDWLGKLNQMARLGDYQPPEAKSEGEEALEEGAAPAAIAAQDQGIEQPEESSVEGSPEPGSADANRNVPDI